MIALKYYNNSFALSTLLIRLFALIIIVFGVLKPAYGQIMEKAIISGSQIDNYGRIIINFVDRYDLPPYNFKSENGILIVEFEEPVDLTLPDFSANLSQFIIAARVDPDNKGVRFALKADFRVNKMEAGEQLFLDILPLDWSGEVPGLPAQVVEKLSQRSKDALKLAEQKRKEEYIREHSPKAIARIGRHPTFIRLLIDWDIEVEGEFSFDENMNIGELKFDWPVPIDLYALKIDLPAEIKNVSNYVDIDGSKIILKTADGVEPRFFSISKKQYVIDIDIKDGKNDAVDIASLLPEEVERIEEDINDNSLRNQQKKVLVNVEKQEGERAIIEPELEKIGSTIRLTFPFDVETGAAVFKRGETLWMVFETNSFIKEPKNIEDFAFLSDSYNVVNGSGTSIVRINMPAGKLATLGSKGRSWVLSLGDIVLEPGEIISLTKKQTGQGLFEIVADIDRAVNVHEIRDPEVGDILEVVTVYPPTLSLVRTLSFVEFSALKSVHGLVIQPLHEDITLRLEDKKAIISSEKGLIVSTSQSARISKTQELQDISRAGFIELKSLVEENPKRFTARRNGLFQIASQARQGERAQMLLNLAKFYLANNLTYEALGILDVAADDMASDKTSTIMEMTKAAALTFSNRSGEALKILNDEKIANEMDAMIWRTIAKKNQEDFVGARQDALSGETVISGYPLWIRNEFFLAASEAAIEYGDISLAIRYLSQITTDFLNEEKLGKYIILSARIDEANERYDEALDSYGQIISTDNRPMRAEAIYRTLKLLRKMGRLNSVQGAQTLAVETMVWRGDRMEVKMLELLARLNFETGAYREAFENVRQFSQILEKGDDANELLELAQEKFAELFLDGRAEVLDPIEALSLYYDFRYLTPPGAKGDQMIRNLARRLVKVDLLEQAAQLLQYQVEERLEGIAKVQIASDLAVIYIANRQPEKAIRLLNSTRIAGIPASLERQRRVLEARALIDVGREDLALDILSKIDGKDADLLKIDAHWKAKRYSKAGEIIENLYKWEVENNQLSKAARDNIVKAAVGYVLANDIIGLSRLELKYGAAMANTPEYPLFSFVSSEVNSSSVEFSKVVSEIADIDGLNAFLSAYKDNYGADGALTPKSANS